MSLVQTSKGYDSYLDERGRGKAKKLANIAIYRLFDRMCVSFGVMEGYKGQYCDAISVIM